MAKEHIVHIALDDLPEGGADQPTLREAIKHARVPDGVSVGTLMKDSARIAWPCLLELVLTQLTSMADQVMVGNMAGEKGILGLSAVGLAAQPKFLLMTMIIALNVGGTAIIARFRGRGDRKNANQVLRQSMLLNLILGIFFTAIGLIFAEPLIRFMSGSGISAAAMGQAAEYLRIQLYGFVPLCLCFTVTASLRGVGDTRTPMLYNTMANVINLIFNYILIYGKLGCPELGVTGASIATVIGQMAAFFVAMSAVLGQKHYLSLNFGGKFTFDGDIMKSVINIGLPSMVEQLFMRTGIMIFTRTVAGLGDVAFATHNICMSIQAMSFMLGQAFGNSATTLIGQSLGKKRNDMATLYMKFTRRLGLMCSSFMGLLLILFSGQIISLYNATPEVIKAGSIVLVMIGLSQPVQSSQFITSGGLRGAGDTRYTAMVMAITTFGVRSLLGILFVNVMNLGLMGAWYALMADQCMRSLLIVLRYNSGKWVHTIPGEKAA